MWDSCWGRVSPRTATTWPAWTRMRPRSGCSRTAACRSTSRGSRRDRKSTRPLFRSVGLVLGACLAENGNNVACVDKDEAKVRMLEDGRMPIYEPGLEELVRRNDREERLTFTTDLASAVHASQIVFIAVGTPQGEDGSADLRHVIDVARDIGRAINKYTVIVDKSTVPVGTATKVRQAVARETKQAFSVVSNPEFLKQGAAVEDSMKPYRVL